MWTKHELKDLEDTFRDIKLEEIVDSEELEVIKRNPARYRNLVNRVIVPPHNRSVNIQIEISS